MQTKQELIEFKSRVEQMEDMEIIIDSGDPVRRLEQIKEAIKNNDYAAWSKLLNKHPHSERFVNEATFKIIVKSHELLAAGDKKGARQLLKDSGIKPPLARFHR